MIEGRINITASRKPKRELAQHERVYNVLLLVMSLLAFVSVAVMAKIDYIDTGMYWWTMGWLVISYWAFKVR